MATDVIDETLNMQLTECLKQGIIGTFSACGIEPTYEGDSNNSGPCDGVVGIISLVGDVAWSVMLGLPRETAVALALQFAGFEIEFDSLDMGDVVGEMANVLAGDVSAQMERLGVRVDLSLPTAARGHDVEVLYPEELPSVFMRFSCKIGPFWVKLVTTQVK